MPSHSLPLTGERTLPGIWHENYWFRRHEIAYLSLAPLARGAFVLDAGCGEGYGVALLTADGGEVVGVDLDLPTLTHARRAYPTAPFIAANLVALPFTAGTVDTVISLQVVEHLWDQPGFVAECARVTRPFGLLAMSTPNRLTFSPDQPAGTDPANPFHSRELDPDELIDLVASHYDVAQLLGVHHGKRLRRWEADHGPISDQLLACSAEHWPRHLRDLVESIDADDFTVSGTGLADSLDLLVVAERRP